jgi:calcium/proton exchanger cax
MTARWLLAAVPLALALAWREAPPPAVFLAALVAVVPLVGLIGDATERIAARLGPTLGGLLNSTLNNLPELIIGGVALSNGLTAVVKASRICWSASAWPSSRAVSATASSGSIRGGSPSTPRCS